MPASPQSTSWQQRARAMIRFEHAAVPIVLAAVLIDSIGFGIVMPVLPKLVTTLGHVGLEEATRIAGWMLVVFAIGQFFAGPVLGNLSDRYGRRPVLIASMLAFAVDFALMAAAPTLAWLFVGRLIAGVAGSIIGPASAVLADVTPAEKRGAVFSLIGAAFGFGFIIGPALGGLVAELGTRAPFILSSALAATNALIMFLAMPETLAPENRRPFHLRDAHIVGSFRPLFHAGDAAPLLVAWFLWQLASMVYPTIWAFWCAIQLGWGARAIGWSLAFVGLSTVIVQLGVTARAIGRFGERRAALVGMTCATTTFALYAVARHGWQVYAFFVIGAFAGFVYPAMNGLLSRMVDATRQGALQGGMSSLSSVAAIIGPILFSQALATGVEHRFAGAAFALAALMTGASLVLLMRALKRVPPVPTTTAD